jgi:hypothetical protein
VRFDRLLVWFRKWRRKKEPGLGLLSVSHPTKGKRFGHIRSPPSNGTFHKVTRSGRVEKALSKHTSESHWTRFLCLSGKRICSKSDYGVHFFIASPLISIGAAVVYSFVLCSVTGLVRFASSCRLVRFASFARSASRGCLVRSPEQTIKQTTPV